MQGQPSPPQQPPGGAPVAAKPTGNPDQASSQNIMEICGNLHQPHRLNRVMVTPDPDLAPYPGRQPLLGDGAISPDSRKMRPHLEPRAADR